MLAKIVFLIEKSKYLRNNNFLAKIEISVKLCNFDQASSKLEIFSEKWKDFCQTLTKLCEKNVKISAKFEIFGT